MCVSVISVVNFSLSTSSLDKAREEAMIIMYFQIVKIPLEILKHVCYVSL